MFTNKLRVRMHNVDFLYAFTDYVLNEFVKLKPLIPELRDYPDDETCIPEIVRDTRSYYGFYRNPNYYMQITRRQFKDDTLINKPSKTVPILRVNANRLKTLDQLMTWLNASLLIKSRYFINNMNRDTQYHPYHM